MTAGLPAQQNESIYQMYSGFETVIRAQNPGYLQPNTPSTFGVGPAPTFVAPSNGYIPPNQNPVVPYQAPQFAQPQGVGAPYNPVAPYGDPFLSGQPMGAPYGFSDINGPQPFRYGWTDYLDFGYAPKKSVSGVGGAGQLSWFEFDYRREFVQQAPSGWVWTFSPEYNLRSLGGPGAPNIAPDFHRFAAGIKANSPSNGPMSWQLGFTPSVGTDFGGGLNSDAWMFDAEVTLFSRLSQDLQLVLGVLYWDRVDDIILPNVGFVWTPNQYTEWRLVFPNPRVDFYLGTPYGSPMWFYARAQYNVEAYQADITRPAGPDEHFQVEDWRAFIGIRTDNGYVSSFFEVGAVFDREFEFKNPANNFEANTGFMFRTGFRF